MKMPTKYLAAGAVLVVLGAVFYLLNWKQAQSQPEKLVIADGQQAAFALLYIARDKGLFREQGLEVEFRHFTLGRDALQDAIAGNSDVATVFELPFVRQVFGGQRIAAVSTLHTSTDNTQIIAKKSSGIRAPADLVGKRIGVVKGTNSEFLFYTYLQSQGLSFREVVRVDITPEQFQNFPTDKSLDVVVVWNPYLAQLKAQLGDDATVFVSELYQEYSLLVGKQENLQRKQKAVVRLLEALVRAKEFYDNGANRDEVNRIVQGSVPGTTVESVAESFKNVHVTMKLNNVMLANLEREGHWLQQQENLAAPVPNFRDFIFDAPLRSVKPEEVTVF